VEDCLEQAFGLVLRDSNMALITRNSCFASKFTIDLFFLFCFCSDDEVANAASETIKSLARFPDAMVCV
jgi:hypothetical protein